MTVYMCTYAGDNCGIPGRGVEKTELKPTWRMAMEWAVFGAMAWSKPRTS